MATFGNNKKTQITQPVNGSDRQTYLSFNGPFPGHLQHRVFRFQLFKM